MIPIKGRTNHETLAKDNRDLALTTLALETNGRRLLDVIEAALFVGARPLTWTTVSQALPGASKRDFQRAIGELRIRYRRQRRPYGVVRRDDGFVLELVDPYRTDLLERMQSQHPVKLDRAVINVLSVVAYRQPIAKGDLDELLGLDVAGPLRQLVRRGLVTVTDPNAKPALYGTTERFLELFGLESLADLPARDDL